MVEHGRTPDGLPLELPETGWCKNQPADALGVRTGRHRGSRGHFVTQKKGADNRRLRCR
jgi:hypothetical protein